MHRAKQLNCDVDVDEKNLRTIHLFGNGRKLK